MEESKSTKLRALLVEDEGMTILLLRRALTTAGYDVVGAVSDGEQGVVAARTLKPDFVIMDINMPRMSGIEAARLITDESPIPIIMLTAYSDEVLVGEAIEACGMVSACRSAFEITGKPLWIQEARRAFSWFLGVNVLQHPLYDPQTGGCADGLHHDRHNQNQGAESTLSFLQSLVEMAFTERNTPPTVRNYHENHYNTRTNHDDTPALTASYSRTSE